ncbi:MAG: flagellar hook protein FlgE [Candidatus Brocadiaceae bacterium]|nr:flagellar hook protein FlgE [Candidatus Brocadiaceae bacterium]
MGLGGALYSGVSGIRAHQNMLDVIGNNLANINTYGYKSSRLLFSDLLSQTMSNGNNGNPMQVGKGVKIGSISSNYSQGTLETTNNALDFAIQGEGFFVVSGGDKDFFTRVGSFDTDSNNYLIDSNTGYKVVDTNGNTISIPYNSTVSGKATSKVSLTGNLDASAANETAEVVMMTGSLTSSNTAATASTTLNSLDSNTTDYVSGDTILITGTKPDGTSVSVTFTYGTTADGTTVGALITKINTAFSSGTTNGATASLDSTGKIVVKSDTGGKDNLSTTLTDGGSNTGKSTWANHDFTGATYTTSVDVYDSQGTKHTVTVRFTKQGDNKWEMNASMNSSNGIINTSTISDIAFNGDGTFSTSGSTTLAFEFNGIGSTQSVILNLGTSGKSDGLTQNGSNSTAAATSQDGYEYGTFDSISVDSGGSITALYTNGITQTVATLKIALFNNLNGLSKQGDNLYTQTSAAGEPIYVTAGSGRAGSISSGYLEGSNVDMATELTSLIIAQRGFQLNTKVITTADEILSDIVNLKR